MAQSIWNPPFSSPRRRFVLGAATAGLTGTAFGPLARAAGNEPNPSVLTGNRFDLTIGEMPVSITGRRRIATVANGSLPAPTLRMREGETVTINVTNRLKEPTSIHWHGVLLPNPMDGVPGLTFRGIMPGETFTYRFPIKQSGTYWYHSHSGMQEQTGLYGALLLEPRTKEPFAYDREHVILLTDWTDENPMTLLSNLKQQSDYYNFQRRTLGTFIDDAKRVGVSAALQDRLMWGDMRMSPTDILDVTGATYTYLINGQSPAANWTALFTPGERVRLRVINGSSMTIFDVRIPGLQMSVVAADGNEVEPVAIDEFRIGVAETYDVIVTPGDQAYTLFAQAQDRSGYARATLTPRMGMTAAVPALDRRPLRTMKDMGMGGAPAGSSPPMDHSVHGAAMQAEDHSAHMHALPPGGLSATLAGTAAENADHVDPNSLPGQIHVDNVAIQPVDRLGEPGAGLENNGRRVLVYNDLKSLKENALWTNPPREIVFHLTGNMERFTWGFDGKKFSQSAPVRVKLGETIRFILVNNTMMEHPIHLHGFFFALDNGQDCNLPMKHTVNVKPGERLSFVVIADTPGRWAFHCHLLYHMEMGMFRTVIVA